MTLEFGAMSACDDGAWELGEGEFEAALAFDQAGRYDYFVHRVVAQGALWTLFHGEELAVAADGEYVPVFPHPRFASASAVSGWEGCEPERVELDEWESTWAPKLAEQGRSVLVFPRASDHSGWVIGFDDLTRRLELVRNLPPPLSDAEVAELLSLSPAERYVWFLKQVAATGEMWILMDAKDNSIAASGDEVEYIDLWPHPRLAELAAQGPWASYAPASITLEDWDESWAPGFAERGTEALVFPDGDHLGISVALDELRDDLAPFLE